MTIVLTKEMAASLIGVSPLAPIYDDAVNALGAIASGAVVCKLAADEAREQSELELHRADYQACKAQGWESPGELLSAYETQGKRIAVIIQRVARLEDRLELKRCWVEGELQQVPAGTIPDGIECRNETIKLQDQRIAHLERDLALHRDAIAEALKRWPLEQGTNFTAFATAPLAPITPADIAAVAPDAPQIHIEDWRKGRKP